MPKIVDHKQYRKQLLGKSFDLFAQKGYGCITMRHIAQGLSVSTGTLYHYFPSKQALFEQLVEEICQQDISTALTELGERKTLQEAMEGLASYLVKNQDYFLKWTYIWVDFSQHQDFNHLGNTVFNRANLRYRQAVCDFLGIEDLELATFVLNFIDGLLLGKLRGNYTIDISEQCTLLGKILAAYLQQQRIDNATNG